MLSVTYVLVNQLRSPSADKLFFCQIPGVDYLIKPLIGGCKRLKLVILGYAGKTFFFFGLAMTII